MSTPTIPHDELKRLAEKHNLSHVIMLAHQANPYMDYVVTWGDSVKDADQAAEFGNRLKDAMGWPESLHQQSAQVTERIAALLAEIDALKSEIELLRVELGNRPSPGQKPVDVWPDRW